MNDGFIDGSAKARASNPTKEEEATEATYIDVIAIIQAVNKKSK